MEPKDLDQISSLPKAYDPHAYEQSLYEKWEASGGFSPREGESEPFTVLMPPPNANGNLHLGHALTLAIQDSLVRYQRMQGKAALYLPGADHAGFETQVVYERVLEEKGQSRFDFTADQLRTDIYDFVQNNKSNMEAQVRSLGASCDWTRNSFTLDEHIVKNTYDTFKKLWDDNLIYRGKRIVNYCTHHDTSFSDLEVEYEERSSKLYSIRYPLEDGSGEVVVATTRPETMLGDTAVAVHPDDSRYQEMIGKTIHLPLVERPIPVVADSGVDPEFGTGAVKVTPAHDQLDFEIGERHNLPTISIIDTTGKITDEAPLPYHGLDVLEARKKVIEDLKTSGFLEGGTKHKHSVGICYKCGTTIEPLIRDQWLVHMKPLAEKAATALREGEIAIHPTSKKKVLLDWLENIHDWNISRQIAWGIPIPAFVNASDPEDWIFESDTSQETLHRNGKTYHRDPDVFDTWFSSGQWPFATLHFPDGEDFKRFYPNNLMETGADILFFWVARMIMLGIYRTGEVPFRDVYLHGLVLDENGQKMSKSKGNVIAPQEIQTEYGTDALRVGLISGRSAGANQAFDRSKVIAGRNFANKLWNLTRYSLSKLDEDYQPATPQPLNLADRWILSRLNQVNIDVQKNVESYRLAQAWEQIYSFAWDDFADWYIEANKAESNPDLLVFVLESILKLAHPFTPFATEALWQNLPWREGLLMEESWPKPDSEIDTEALDQFSKLQKLVGEIRTLYAELDLNRQTLYYLDEPMLENNADLIAKLARLEGCEQVSDGRGLPVPGVEVACWLDVDEHTVKRYRKNLQNNLDEASASIESLQARLDNKGYIKNAPKEVVEETKQLLEATLRRSQTLQEQLDRLDTTK